MKIKKIELSEIIDSNGELIGNENIPKTGSNLNTAANNTTDYNAQIGTQPYRYDMLGRFGFSLMPFLEGKNETNEQLLMLNDIANILYDKYKENLGVFYKNPNDLKIKYRIFLKYNFDDLPEKYKKEFLDFARNIIFSIKPHIEKSFEKFEEIVENKIVEDWISNTKNEIELSKHSNDLDIKDIKLKNIAGLINKLNINDRKKLINLIEIK